MTNLTGDKTINGTTNAVVLHSIDAMQSGYAQYEVVVFGGVAWLSLVDGNKTVPGEGTNWDLYE